MKKILITGGTGLVGQHLSKLLIHKGYEVVMLSRQRGEENGIRRYKWDIKKGEIEDAAFYGVNHVVHLAGAGVADHRWNDTYKHEIYNSRILSTRLLTETIKRLSLPLQSLISASGTGIYGDDVKGITDEKCPAGESFLSKVCMDWEGAASFAARLGIRTVMIRTGVVLAKESGFIPEVTRPMKWFAGAPLGTGKQMVSWIHIDDLCGIYLQAIEDSSLSGAYNAVAPQPAGNKEITVKMGRKLHRPVWLPPVPGFVLRILVGEIAATLVGNLAVSSGKIEQAGYRFRYPQIDAALDSLL